MTNEQLPDRDLFGGRPHEYVLPEYAARTVCRSCRMPIAFVRTSAGKAMPLSLATVEERDGVRYCLPHWIDCPQADEWKGGKR